MRLMPAIKTILDKAKQQGTYRMVNNLQGTYKGSQSYNYFEVAMTANHAQRLDKKESIKDLQLGITLKTNCKSSVIELLYKPARYEPVTNLGKK